MNNARETERERERDTWNNIIHVVHWFSLLACVAHNRVNTCNFIWKKEKKRKKKEKKSGEPHFPKKRDVMYWLNQEFISLIYQLIYISLILETKKVECPSNPWLVQKGPTCGAINLPAQNDQVPIPSTVSPSRNVILP